MFAKMTVKRNCHELLSWFVFMPQFCRDGLNHGRIPPSQGHPARFCLANGRPESDAHSRAKDPLRWAILQIAAGGPDQECLDPGMMFAFLEDVLHSDNKQRKRVDGITDDLLTRIAAAYEMLSIVRNSRPRTTNLEEEDILDDKTSFASPMGKMIWFLQTYNGSTNLLEDYTAENPMQYKDCAAALRKLTEPASALVPGSRDTAWLAQRRADRQGIEDIWTCLRGAEQTFMALCGLEPNRLAEHLEIISAAKGEEYAAIVHVEAESIKSSNSTGETYTPSFATGNSQDLAFRPQRQAADQAESSTSPSRETGEPVQQEAVPAAPIQPQPSPPIIVQRKSSWKILTRMFRDPSSAKESGKAVHWKAFVQTMEDVGFTAHNRSGSAVSFRLRDGGSINFHRPHPEPKLSQFALRVNGCRMERNFGWSAGGFVLGESEE
jgi:hypothetical protein